MHCSCVEHFSCMLLDAGAVLVYSTSHTVNIYQLNFAEFFLSKVTKRSVKVASFEFPQHKTWEEIASDIPSSTPDTEKLMWVMLHAFDSGLSDKLDMPKVLDFFRRARWSKPTNLSATANHCASKGWLTEAGQDENRKLWAITCKGHTEFSSRKESIS